MYFYSQLFKIKCRSIDKTSYDIQKQLVLMHGFQTDEDYGSTGNAEFLDNEPTK